MKLAFCFMFCQVNYQTLPVLSLLHRAERRRKNNCICGLSNSCNACTVC